MILVRTICCIILIAIALFFPIRLQGTESRPDNAWASGTSVSVTPGLSKKHHMPPVSFSVDTKGTCFIATLFPDRDTYLILSGPPGGLLNVIFMPFSGTGDTEKALRALVIKRLAANSGPAPVFGRIRDVELKGRQYMALPFIAGSGLSRANWNAIYIPKEGGSFSDFVILCGVSAPEKDTVPDALKTVAESNIGKILRSLSIRTD